MAFRLIHGTRRDADAAAEQQRDFDRKVRDRRRKPARTPSSALKGIVRIVSDGTGAIRRLTAAEASERTHKMRRDAERARAIAERERRAHAVDRFRILGERFAATDDEARREAIAIEMDALRPLVNPILRAASDRRRDASRPMPENMVTRRVVYGAVFVGRDANGEPRYRVPDDPEQARRDIAGSTQRGRLWAKGSGGHNWYPAGWSSLVPPRYQETAAGMSRRWVSQVTDESDAD